jgi:hypothetical protein
MKNVEINLHPLKDSVICDDEEEFNSKMIIYIAGTEKAFIPQKPDLIGKEALALAAKEALDDDAKLLVPSVVTAASPFRKDFNPYIILMSSDHKMFMFPYDGEAFSDSPKKKKVKG